MTEHKVDRLPVLLRAGGAEREAAAQELRALAALAALDQAEGLPERATLLHALEQTHR